MNKIKLVDESLPKFPPAANGQEWHTAFFSWAIAPADDAIVDLCFPVDEPHIVDGSASGDAKRHDG